MKKDDRRIFDAIVRLSTTFPDCYRHMFIVPADASTRELFDRRGHETHIDGKVLLVCRKAA